MGLDAYGLGNESFSNNQKTPSMSYFRHVSFDDSWEKSDSIYSNAPTQGLRNSQGIMKDIITRLRKNFFGHKCLFQEMTSKQK